MGHPLHLERQPQMIARFPTFPVALLCGLLSVATSAQAECVWELWRESRVDDLAPGRPDEPVKFFEVQCTWKVILAYSSKAECEYAEENVFRRQAIKDQPPILKDGKAVGPEQTQLPRNHFPSRQTSSISSS